MAQTATNGPSADVRDRVQKGLSEIRTTVLGVQILLGFQYNALFQPAFEHLAPWRKTVELASFALLVLSLALMIAPASRHQLAERGESTADQAFFTRRMIAASLAPFAVALGLNIVVATTDEFGAAAAFLLSPAASYITGASLRVDGGSLRSI